MSLGKAAVFKHIPVYYPKHVGAVGGLVGMIGGLGGFVLPIAFGVLLDLTGIWTSCFAFLFVLVGDRARLDAPLDPRDGARGARRGARPAAGACPRCRRSTSPPRHARRAVDRGLAARGPGVLGKRRAGRIARRNLCDSRFRPAARRSRSGWSGRWWSRGCRDRLRLHPRPALLARGAARRSRGRRSASSTASWCRSSAGGCGRRSSTASLLLPAFGIGYAVQNPETPYLIFLVLALLCGSAAATSPRRCRTSATSSPRREKGNALALNAGARAISAFSVMQFLVPVVMTIGVFGALGGARRR